MTVQFFATEDEVQEFCRAVCQKFDLEIFAVTQQPDKVRKRNPETLKIENIREFTNLVFANDVKEDFGESHIQFFENNSDITWLDVCNDNTEALYLYILRSNAESESALKVWRFAAKKIRSLTPCKLSLKSLRDNKFYPSKTRASEGARSANLQGLDLLGMPRNQCFKYIES